jgi:hypothetical protein
MNRGVLGAATVGVVWVISLVVLLLFSGGFLYLLASERATLEANAARADREKDAETERANAALLRVIELSKVVGFRNEQDPDSRTDVAQVAGTIQQLQDNYSAHGISKEQSSLSRVVERMKARLDELTRQLNESKQQATAAEQARASLEQAKNDLSNQKDEAYAQLQRQLQDERDRNASQETADRNRIDELNKRQTDLEARARSEKEALETRVAELVGEVRKRDGRIAELQKKVEYIRLPDEPDGSVVAVSNANTCYVDLGTRDLLRRGTRFKVFTYGKGGEIREKGMIEVSSVREDSAEATVIELRDRYDPIARGDRIAAPNYDPKMPREFVLIGRFPTGYSRAMVADRLRALGANVADKVGPTTDFLVVGDKETGAAAEGGEEEGAAADETAEPEEMKLAQLYRVQILPVREILEFLNYE